MIGFLPICVFGGTTKKAAYTVVPTKKAPVIDGKLNDAVWKKAKFQTMYAFASLEEQKRSKAIPGTRFAISADTKNLYVAYKCEDPHINRLKKKRTAYDSYTWDDDSVELFVDFDNTKHRFARIALSVTGAIYDNAYLQYGLKDIQWKFFNIRGIKGAANIQKDGWTGELSIPFAGLNVAPDRSGDWSMNFFRTNRTMKKGHHKTYSSWGLYRKKPIKNYFKNFEPINIIGAVQKNDAVFKLFQNVKGIPNPVYTKKELKEVMHWRNKYWYDVKPETFPMIVIPEKIPLEKIMFYLDENGKRQAIKTAAHLEIKRKQMLGNVEKVMGSLPKRVKKSSWKAYDVRVSKTLIRGRSTKKTIHFFVAEGEEVHANLYEPIGMKPGDKLPAIVAMHPTHNSGKEAFEKWPNNNFVFELAMQGFIVIVPDFPSKGGSLKYDFKADRYASGPLKGLYNHMTCVDMLQVHPNVDPEKIGTIGHSLGGANVLNLAAFDTRIKVAVSSCGWTTLRTKVMLSEKHMATEYFMPRFKTVYKMDLAKFPFEYTELVAAIAPRVFFSNSPLADGVHTGWGPKAGAPIIREYYAAHNAKDAFQFYQPRAGHAFPWTYRQMAYKSMRDVLNYHPDGNLGLLADRKGKAAIPKLKQSLKSPSQKTRRIAAHHLGVLGDKSGLLVLKADFKSVAKIRLIVLDKASNKGAKDVNEETLALATVLAELGDTSGFSFIEKLSVKGDAGQRWRACIALCRMANIDKKVLKSAGVNPVAVLKKMAAEEPDYSVFFVFLDRVHKILRNRSDMIAIFAIAKESKFHKNSPKGMKHPVAEAFHFVAVRDRNRPYDYK
ncbi:MAG: dienelactone hydrolase family protein [Lentisphaeria bacterium]|nr:dienelactone hydrolase family protein [Lentisphaeria bacterium]